MQIDSERTRSRARMPVVPALIAAALVMLSGCHGIGSSRPIFREHIHSALDKFSAAHELSRPVDGLLESQGLRELVRHDPDEVMRRIETTPALESDPIAHLTIGELSHRTGHAVRHRAPSVAMERFRDAAAASSATLAIGPTDPTVCETARRLHNQAVNDLMILVMDEAHRSGRPWTVVAREAGVNPVGATDFVDPRRFATVDPTSTYQISGMNNRYHNDGLGVPLVAIRPVDRDHPREPIESLYPRRLHVSATAVMMPPQNSLTSDWRSQPASLVLHDPFETRKIPLGGSTVPLATDRTTQLAVQVSQGKLGQIAFLGLFQAEAAERGAGLYSLRPYQPNKIPLVLIHGLFSSPEAWAQTMNELQNDPVINAKYQLWFFMYPTGNLIPVSAVTLRKALTKAVNELDPTNSNPFMQNMVLIGHSMGGNLTRMMTQSTGEKLWNAILTIPRDQLQASPKTLQFLNEALVYERLPFVTRAIFVAAPHRGSRLGDELIGRTVSRFVQPESEIKTMAQELVGRYGRDVFSADVRINRVSSIGNLAHHSPILMAVDSLPVDQNVTYHSIIPLIPGTQTDGVVTYGSSNLPGAASEVIVAGIHVDQEKPEVTAEIKRILYEHGNAIGQK